jgi:hypothetical protein
MLRLEKDTARKELMSANMKKRGLEADDQAMQYLVIFGSNGTN